MWTYLFGLARGAAKRSCEMKWFRDHHDVRRISKVSISLRVIIFHRSMIKFLEIIMCRKCAGNLLKIGPHNNVFICHEVMRNQRTCWKSTPAQRSGAQGEESERNVSSTDLFTSYLLVMYSSILMSISLWNLQEITKLLFMHNNLW